MFYSFFRICLFDLEEENALNSKALPKIQSVILIAITVFTLLDAVILCLLLGEQEESSGGVKFYPQTHLGYSIIRANLF